MKKIKLKNINLFEVFKKIRKKRPYMALLESFGDDIQTCQYNILGLYPSEHLVVKEGLSTLTCLKENLQKTCDWSDIINQWAPLGVKSSTGLQTGAIGYLGYEIGECFEKLTISSQTNTELQDIELVNYKMVLWEELRTGDVTLVYDSDISESDVRDNIKLIYSIGNMQPVKFLTLGDIQSLRSKKEHIDAVSKAIDYINRGDIFQANITTKFKVGYIGDPISLYEELRLTTPNCFFAYLDLNIPVISTSPERFYKINGDLIETYPIKGTVKFQGKEDEAMQKKILLNSDKDRAENMMIVDLMRNDLGRVCQKGTVSVPIICELKKFNNLFHLESIVKGRLKAKVTNFDVLKATFPGGSITGAPKIRAMEIINELEEKRRNIYCGAIGFWGRQGYVDTSIAIRTLYFDSKNLYFHAGGGIVVDSNCDDEYIELCAKVQLISNTIDQFNIFKDLGS